MQKRKRLIVLIGRRYSGKETLISVAQEFFCGETTVGVVQSNLFLPAFQKIARKSIAVCEREIRETLGRYDIVFFNAVCFPEELPMVFSFSPGCYITVVYVDAKVENRLHSERTNKHVIGGSSAFMKDAITEAHISELAIWANANCVLENNGTLDEYKNRCLSFFMREILF